MSVNDRFQFQMWDLTTALDMYHSNRDQFRGSNFPQGPTPDELLHLIDECEVTCNSLCTTPTSTPMGSNLTLAATRQNSDDKHTKETDF